MSVVAVVLLSLGAALAALAAWVGGNLLRFAVDRSAFRCRLGRGDRWCRWKTTAWWRRDVLVVRVGPLWVRTRRIPVRLPLHVRITEEPPFVMRRLGSRPQSLSIRSNDGELRIAVRHEDRTRLAGPFLGLALQGPPAPRSGWYHR